VRITCFHRTGDPALSALAEGARAVGHVVKVLPGKYWRPGELDETAETVIVVGLHGSAHRLRDLYAGRGVPVWVMDLPRLRQSGALAGFTFHGLHWLPAATPELRTPVTPGVLADRTPSRVLVVGQVPGDAAHGLDLDELREWTRVTIADLRSRTDLPIHYRSHPKVADLGKFDVDGYDRAPSIREALQDTACVVTYNSTVGWDAIDAGVPVVALGPREDVGYADYVTMGLPASIADVPALDADRRLEALQRVAATCWTLEELSSGAAARAMFGAAEVLA
jgi:hypothetical protein